MYLRMSFCLKRVHFMDINESIFFFEYVGLFYNALPSVFAQ